MTKYSHENTCCDDLSVIEAAKRPIEACTALYKIKLQLQGIIDRLEGDIARGENGDTKRTLERAKEVKSKVDKDFDSLGCNV